MAAGGYRTIECLDPTPALAAAAASMIRSRIIDTSRNVVADVMVLLWVCLGS